MENFNEKFQSWLESCQNLINDYYAKHYTNLTPPVLKTKTGSKFIKIISLQTAQSLSGSAWAFINKENGDVLKPASWNVPAKHARGNIFSADNGMATMTPYGPAYLR